MLATRTTPLLDSPTPSESFGPTYSLHSNLTDPDTTATVDAYLKCCKLLDVPSHPSVLIFLRLRLSELKPVLSAANAQAPFCDSDLYAFCEFVLRDGQEVYEHWQSINLECCKISPAGCQILAHILRQPG